MTAQQGRRGPHGAMDPEASTRRAHQHALDPTRPDSTAEPQATSLPTSPSYTTPGLVPLSCSPVGARNQPSWKGGAGTQHSSISTRAIQPGPAEQPLDRREHEGTRAPRDQKGA